MLKKTTVITLILLSIFSLSTLHAQNTWSPIISPDGKYSVHSSEKARESAACLVTTLSLKGEGIEDSLIVSQTSAFDCPKPQFFWSKNRPLLIVESSFFDNGCDGPRQTRVFDLETKEMIYTTDGQLFLFDNQTNKAILYTGVSDSDAYGNVSKFFFNLHVLDITNNVKLPMCSLETYPVDCKGDFALSFDEKAPGTVMIKFLNNQNRMANDEFRIRY